MTEPSLQTTWAIRARGEAARALRVLEYGLDALTLGLFSDESLDALSASYYDRSRTYGANAHNHQGLFDWEKRAIDDFFPKEGKILVTSAGGGREAISLLGQGYEVVATECVESLYGVLKSNLEAAASPSAARAIHLPPDAVPAEHGPFDAAVIGWTAYTHLVGRERRFELLHRLSRSLRPGAPALVSYWGQSHDYSRGQLATAAIANIFRRPLGRRPIEPGETTRLGHHQRNCTVQDVLFEASQAGFAVLAERRSWCPHVVVRAPCSGTVTADGEKPAAAP